jgi:hypothetical protein
LNNTRLPFMWMNGRQPMGHTWTWILKITKVSLCYIDILLLGGSMFSWLSLLGGPFKSNVVQHVTILPWCVLAKYQSLQMLTIFEILVLELALSGQKNISCIVIVWLAQTMAYEKVTCDDLPINLLIQTSTYLPTYILVHLCAQVVNSYI